MKKLLLSAIVLFTATNISPMLRKSVFSDKIAIKNTSLLSRGMNALKDPNYKLHSGAFWDSKY